jgi:hypothetical protein
MIRKFDYEYIKVFEAGQIVLTKGRWLKYAMDYSANQPENLSG